MTLDDITVHLRLNTKTESKSKAFADVSVSLGPEGVIKMSGYSVLPSKDRSNVWVAPPARKGTTSFFPVVHLAGRIESLVSEAVMRAYHRAVSEREGR